ncbi:NAD(P)/FAD-dependent oxidoreductase [Calidifontibacillus erzurumensis]|uniref:NAD(P)/FAD-dependent oxidoreductase n=1 Tax=Calidifontibacillus erzurumensis TaxID=2741433 RepID=A0A8J8KC49_9BACI|nr:NAD(P)/FAD-dependent oxidoreductase [Calidifontibacillus erzurumensis]NSL51698.1 NAD(P)/FAD-dependent oxidoreductase [Calidifontibacillus erzurumensis]
MNTLKRPNVVILGAGYGGLMTAVNLQRTLGVNEANITLVNKHDYHYQSTWLHEGAAGTIHHDQIRIPIKDVIQSNKIDFVKDTVVEINPKEKKVKLENGELSYDYLVIGLGFEAETFGIKGLKEYAFSIANINSARLIREHIDYCFARYNNEPEEKRDELLTFVVGGAGFTGIEFLGELVNRIPQLCQEFDIDRKKVRLICVEAAPTPLPGFNQQLVEYAMDYLEQRGVEFKLGTIIKECSPEGIIVSKDDEVEEIKAKTVVWAAGVRGNSIVEKSGFETMRGRVKVEPDLRAPGYEDVFVVGDCALLINEEINRPYPPTAQIAIQMADTCAANIAALVRGKEEEIQKFVPNIRGTVCSLGHDDAMGIIFGNRKLYGTQAAIMKKIIDNRYLWKLGGLSLVLKKGKLKFF